nr:MAG: hypothetical protein BECKTUN1418F_GA0071002_12451 [Candidatus Kentron sp. TUN]VFK70090.1 MAG: hypothetical protein BECKTUN1418E_GA0071001_12341 [Candidatus Kentron sp. TUN]
MKKSKSHYSVWSKPLIASTMLVAALFVYANPEQSNIPDPALENRPYHHPFFQDDGLARGISFDTLKGADGSSYTVQQGISVGESGVVEKFSGVVKVEKRQLSPQER